MQGTLYRYPHPLIEGRWLYVGQGPDRDARHRLGTKGFGKRFKKFFPGVELPQPIKETFEVADQLELNELETIWMFRFHTWRGYVGGMNQTIPGSADYKDMSLIGSRIGGQRFFELYGRPGSKEDHLRGSKKRGPILGSIYGPKNAASGQMAALGRSGVGGRIGGRVSAERGHCARIARLGGLAVSHEDQIRAGLVNKESGQASKLGSKYGKIYGRKNVEDGTLIKANCTRWNIRRGKPCICGKHDV